MQRNYRKQFFVTNYHYIIEFQNNAGSQIGRMNNDGNMYAVSFITTSDIKYKTNIEKLESSLDKINKIEGYSYNWKHDFVGHNEKLQYGVIAQQLEEVGLGHLVENTENSKAVNYIGLIPLLIEAIKELSSKVEMLEKKFSSIFVRLLNNLHIVAGFTHFVFVAKTIF